MDRRQLIAAALAAATPFPAFAATRTRWKVRGSEGFDALCFLGPLSGKPFYAKYYVQDLGDFRPKFPAAAQAALDRLQKVADASGNLLGPGLCTLFSGAADATLADLLVSLDQAEEKLLPPYRKGEYWDADSWAAFLAGRDDLRVVLRGLAEADFAAFRHSRIDARLAARAPELTTKLAGLDVIAEQERLLGRRLDPGIEIILLWFSLPHGIRIQGQRFLSHVAYPDEIVIRIAGHEILHPPFPMDGAAAKAALAVLGRDPLFTRIVAEHDPTFGYNSLEGVLNEDTVQALDQIIAERLGFAAPPAKRWTDSDGGMHVLAAGLYGTLKAEGYDRTGGKIEAWMGNAAKSGKLAPEPLHAAAAQVLGRPADQLWPLPKT